MKTTLTILLILAFPFISCKKDQYPSANLTPDYFIFGEEGGFFGGTTLYLIKDGALYFSKNYNHGLASFYDSVLPHNLYQKAKVVTNNFPLYLTNHADSNYSCMGCSDELYLFIEYKADGVVRRWYIDPDYSPKDVSVYGQHVFAIINSLQ